jgi:hypothetical protein
MFNRTKWNAAQYQPSERNVTRAAIVQRRRRRLQAAERVVFLAVTIVWASHCH